MRISSVYGPVSQGEGLLLGTRMPFIRVAGCNLSCSWCDSAYTWTKGYEYTEMTPEEVSRETLLRLGGCSWVSLTGGEPTIYHKEGSELLDLLSKASPNLRVIVETNGLSSPDWLDSYNVFVSCSPKLPTSGQDSPLRRKKLQRFVEKRTRSFISENWLSDDHQPRTQWKFVIASEEDLETLPSFCSDIGLLPGDDLIYLQPNGYIQPLEDYLHALSWLQENAPPWAKVTPQVHRLIHGPDAKSV